MKIKLLLVGKTTEEYLREGIALYKGRISHYVQFEIVEIPELKGVSSLTREQIKAREGELILKQLRDGDDVILRPPELRSITDLEGTVGKKQFAALCGAWIDKPQGKPALVPESDKRPAYNAAADDFADIK